MQVGLEHHVAARDGILGDAVAGQVERAALPAFAAFGRRFCAWIERTRAERPDGLTVTRSPTLRRPTAQCQSPPSRAREREPYETPSL